MLCDVSTLVREKCSKTSTRNARKLYYVNLMTESWSKRKFSLVKVKYGLQAV